MELLSEFLKKEEKRLDEIFLNNNFKSIKREDYNSTSFLRNSTLLSDERKQLILTTEYVYEENIFVSAVMLLINFQKWFEDIFLNYLSRLIKKPLSRKILIDNPKLEELKTKLGEDEFIISWWQEEGFSFVEALNLIPVPKTLAGFHDILILCQSYIDTTKDRESEFEGLLSVCDFFLYEWKSIEDRLPMFYRVNILP